VYVSESVFVMRDKCLLLCACVFVYVCVCCVCYVLTQVADKICNSNDKSVKVLPNICGQKEHNSSFVRRTFACTMTIVY